MSTENGDDRPARQPTTIERMIVAGSAVVVVVGFLALVGGLAFGRSFSPWAWPLVGVAVMVAYLGLDWFAGRPLPFSVGIKGVDDVGSLLVVVAGLVVGALFLCLLAAALWLAFGPG